MDKVTLVRVDDYRDGLYLNGKCISNAEYNDPASLIHVLCDSLGLEFESIFAETVEEIDKYIPDLRNYTDPLPEG